MFAKVKNYLWAHLAAFNLICIINTTHVLIEFDTMKRSYCNIATQLNLAFQRECIALFLKTKILKIIIVKMRYAVTINVLIIFFSIFLQVLIFNVDLKV